MDVFTRFLRFPLKIGMPFSHVHSRHSKGVSVWSPEPPEIEPSPSLLACSRDYFVNLTVRLGLFKHVELFMHRTKSSFDNSSVDCERSHFFLV